MNDEYDNQGYTNERGEDEFYGSNSGRYNGHNTGGYKRNKGTFENGSTGKKRKTNKRMYK